MANTELKIGDYVHDREYGTGVVRIEFIFDGNYRNPEYDSDGEYDWPEILIGRRAIVWQNGVYSCISIEGCVPASPKFIKQYFPDYKEHG